MYIRHPPPQKNGCRAVSQSCSGEHYERRRKEKRMRKGREFEIIRREKGRYKSKIKKNAKEGGK
jgi:hypothetical protein